MDGVRVNHEVAPYTAQAITVSDRALQTEEEDRSGPVLRKGLTELGFNVREPVIVPSTEEAVRHAINQAVAAGTRVVVTAGGTGVLLTDRTVEVTRALLDYEIPGIMEQVRRVGAEKTTLSLLSRGLVGVIKPASIIT